MFKPLYFIFKCFATLNINNIKAFYFKYIISKTFKNKET